MSHDRPFGILKDLSAIEQETRRDIQTIRHLADVIRRLAEDATDDDWGYFQSSTHEHANQIDGICKKLIGA